MTGAASPPARRCRSGATPGARPGALLCACPGAPAGALRRFAPGAAAALLLFAAGCGDAGLSAAEWRRYEQVLIADGLLRTERAPADAPFTNDALVRAFHEIMFFDEYVLEGGRFVSGRAERTLEKMEGERRVALGGATVTALDRAHVAEAAVRLAAATGQPVIESEHDPNIHLLILTHDERLALKRQLAASPAWDFLAADLPGLSDTVCAAYYHRDEGTAERVDYIILIPAEVGGVLRRSCIEEELGQAFGPGADWEGARPSVFNDDEEFALLTDQDEMLLRILYDPRLKAGMSAAEAMPLVERIVEELRPGG